MTYSVRWREEASDELASLWLSADEGERSVITRAADAIDTILQRAPNDCGESRPAGRRIFFSFPLGVLFQVVESPPVVFVVQVWKVA